MLVRVDADASAAAVVFLASDGDVLDDPNDDRTDDVIDVDW